MQNEAHPAVKLVLKAPKSLQPIAYLSLHAILCWAAMLLTYIWWHSYACHITILLAMLLWSTWNGANFYFEVFAHRYVRSIGLELKPVKKDS